MLSTRLRRSGDASAGRHCSPTFAYTSRSLCVRACFDRVAYASRSSAFGARADAADQLVVLRRRLPVPHRLAGFLDDRMDHLDRRLLLLMSKDDGAEHHFLGQLVRFGFDHQDRGFGAGDDEVQMRRREFGLRRVEHVLAVDIADARAADRAVERNAGQRKRRRCADHRRNVGIDLGIDGEHRRDDLHFVVEALGEERPDRPVDQPRRQRLLFRRAPFTLEEAAGNLARGVRLLLVVDGQREEVLAGPRILRRDSGDEHDGVVEAHERRARGLAGDLAGFDRQRVTTVLNRFLDGVHSFLNP